MNARDVTGLQQASKCVKRLCKPVPPFESHRIELFLAPGFVNASALILDKAKITTFIISKKLRFDNIFFSSDCLRFIQTTKLCSDKLWALAV